MSQSQRPPGTGPAPTARPGRSLAPDLARGLMLLFIALVNAQFFLTHPDTVRSLADQALTLVQSTLVNGRAIPLFSLLFGYGTVWIMRRVTDAGGGWIHTRTVLRRRGFWMLVIGALHGVLLLPVDIVGAYGLGLLLFAGFLRARDAVLLWSAAAFAAGSLALNLTLTLTDALDTAGAGAEEPAAAVPSLVEPGFLAASLERFSEWSLYTPWTLVFVVMPPMLLGMWAGRRRILERPEEHRTLLLRTAVIGLGVAVAAGLPDALVSAEFMPAPGEVPAALLMIMHDVTGWVGGLGWAALIALVAARLTGNTAHRGRGAEVGTAVVEAAAATRVGPVTAAIAAVGERSLSCYLAQAVVFTLVFAPYGLGLGATAGAAAAGLVAVFTWASTVLLAEACRRRGLRGPAETVLRTLVHARLRLPEDPARKG